MDNLTEQREEIEALNSIYEDEWKNVWGTNSFSFDINADVTLFINLIPSYPSKDPPEFDLMAPKLSSRVKKAISKEFQNIYDTYQGPILYQCIERLKEIVESEAENNYSYPSHNETSSDEEKEKEVIMMKTLEISHSEIIQDRKSVFQAHACAVESKEDTEAFLNCLVEMKKISQAKHNISAFRIGTTKRNMVQDFDDDGEGHAGGRVLHLLQVLDVKNVMVVVTRWYGGIQLGADRFKHINNAARLALVQGGFISS